jgi:hypothetical protein
MRERHARLPDGLSEMERMKWQQENTAIVDGAVTTDV